MSKNASWPEFWVTPDDWTSESGDKLVHSEVKVQDVYLCLPNSSISIHFVETQDTKVVKAEIDFGSFRVNYYYYYYAYHHSLEWIGRHNWANQTSHLTLFSHQLRCNHSAGCQLVVGSGYISAMMMNRSVFQFLISRERSVSSESPPCLQFRVRSPIYNEVLYGPLNT